MHERLVKDFVDFIKQTNNFDLIAEVVIYRGQPAKGRLVPAIARKDHRSNTTELEKKVLDQLGLMGASLLPVPTPNRLDLLVIAQHFGLRTRLLDWTSNPLAALWFACSAPTDSDAFVYALEADKVLASEVYDKDPFTVSNTRVFQPRLNNPRIIAQHGWFTLHCYSEKSQMFVPLETNRDTKGSLTEFKIPGGKKSEILSALDRHGVSSRTLFPDLTGLSQHINWKYELG
jgi:FRG domain